MSAVAILAMLASSCSSASTLFYTCTEGTLNLSNLNANACFSNLTFFSNTFCGCDSSTPPPPAALDMSVDCRYIKLEQTDSTKPISLSDISVYDDQGTQLVVRTGDTGVSTIEGAADDNSLANFIDDDSAEPTVGTQPSPDDGAASITLDLGGVKKVHKIVLKNTTDTEKLGDIVGTKAKFLRPAYTTEPDGTTSQQLLETPAITTEADVYTFKITSGTDEWQ